MAPLTPGLAIQAPERLRRRYGLFDAASGPLDLPTHGEAGGVRFVPISCGRSLAYGVACYGGDTPAPVKPLDPDAAEVDTGVFVALATLNCGAVGYLQKPMRFEQIQEALVKMSSPSAERARPTALATENPVRLKAPAPEPVTQEEPARVSPCEESSSIELIHSNPIGLLGATATA